MIDPTKDGIDHINIYSKGETELGQWLSNFAHTPIDLPEGRFNSLEGYWYYLLTPDDVPEKDILKKCWGFETKKLGRKLTEQDWPTNFELVHFKYKFTMAMQDKIDQHPIIKNLLKESTLPFKHYYLYNDKLIEPKNCKWILDFWEDYRNTIKK